MIKQIFSILLYSSVVFLLPIQSGISAEFPSPIHSPNGELYLSFGLFSDMKITPDGKYCIILDNIGILYFINMKTSLVDRIIQGDTDLGYPGMVISPTSQYILVYGAGMTISFLIDLNTGDVIREFTDTLFRTLPFSPNDTYLHFHLYNDAHDYLLNLKTNDVKQYSNIRNTYFIDPTENYFIGFAPAKSTIGVNYWSLLDGSLYNTIEVKDPIKPSSTNYVGIEYASMGFDDNIILGIDSEYFKSGASLTTPYIWDIEKGEKLSHYHAIDAWPATHRIGLSLDKKWMVIYYATEPAIYYLPDYANTADPTIHLNYYTDLCTFYSNSKQILYREFINGSSYNYLLKTLDLESNTVLNEVSLRQRDFRNITFSPDHQSLIFINGYDFDIWDLSIPRFTKRIEDQAKGYGTTIFTPDGRYLFRGSGDAYYGPTSIEPIDITLIDGYGSYVDVYDPLTWSKVTRIQASEDDYRCFVNVSSGNLFLTASGNQLNSGTENIIRIWNTDTWDMVREIHGHTDSVWYAAFSPDDQRIVSASLDGTAKVWNVESGSLVSEFVGHATGIVYAEFLPDGQRVLSVGKDRRAFIWDAETATVEKKFENLRLPVQLSPDGKYLFAGSEVWELASGQVIKTLDGISQDYANLTLSPDGTLLLTCEIGSESGGLTKLWNVQEHILGGSGIREFERY